MPVAAFLSIAAIACYLRFLSYYPNRIAQTQPVFLKNIAPLVFIFFEISVLIAILLNSSDIKIKLIKIINVLFCFAYTIIILCISGIYAQKIYTENHIARISLSIGFWLLYFLIYLIILDAIKNFSSFYKGLTIFIFLSIIALFIFNGFLDKIDTIREFHERKVVFMGEFYTHIYLSLGSVIIALLLSFPLGVLAYRKKESSEKIFSILNIIQTIPSIAMFGILIVPLAYISKHSTFLSSLGISGIGYAPALIALILYAMLPITRNIYTGLKNVPSHIKEASIGMGMSRQQILFKVEIPLSIREILTGVRISLIQTIGNTALAALIGAGGLGVFIFQGLGEASNSLILLGVFPLVALAIFADILMQAVISFFSVRDYDKTD